MKILIVVNGDRFFKKLSMSFFNSFNKIVCADGGLNNLNKINKNIVPDYIIGDFDSISNELLAKYQDKKTIILKKDNQDESDLSFAVSYFLNNYKNIEEITVLCGTGNRFDHTLCNILLFKHIAVKSKIIGNSGEIYLLKDKIEIKNRKGNTLSIIPLTDVKNINCSDLKWQLINRNLDFGFVGGISNIIEKNKITITVENGLAVVVVNFNV